MKGSMLGEQMEEAMREGRLVRSLVSQSRVRVVMLLEVEEVG